MANEALFQALAQAKAQPSKAYRAVVSGANAVKDTVGGYLQGQDIREKLDQHRLLSTPLGSMYKDPSQIPFGLSPDHTVKDLITLAPTMENFIPQTAAQGITDMYAGGGSSTGNSPQVPGSAPAQPVAVPSQDSSVAPAAVFGAAPAAAPRVVIPPGGIGKPAMQMLAPALNAAREGRQFQQGQTNENARFNTGQTNEFTRQATSIAAEDNRARAAHMASATEKIAPSVQDIGGIKFQISQLEPLLAQNSPIPGLGNVEAGLTDKLGGIGTPQMQRGAQINNVAGALSAALDKTIAGRFNENEANLLKQTLVPNANDQPAYALEKLKKLKGFVATLEAGNDQTIRNMSAAITGGRINTVSPGAGAPQGPPRIRVKNKQTGQTGTISADKFDPNRYDQLNG